MCSSDLKNAAARAALKRASESDANEKIRRTAGAALESLDAEARDVLP